MPFIEMTLESPTAAAVYRVFFAPSPEPADSVPLEIVGVTCVEISQAGFPPLPATALDAMQDAMVEAFWRRVSRQEVLEACARHSLEQMAEAVA